jgi:hypothetical protein
MKARIAAVVAVLILPVLFGFVLVTPANAVTTGTQLPDVTWLKGTVDNKSTTQQWLSESLDPSGFSHISYYNSSSRSLWYATNVGGSWKTSQVLGSDNGMYNSIASDGNGVIYLAYYDNTNNKLGLMVNSVGTWSSLSMVDVNGHDLSISGGKYVSLAVDSAGGLHLSYQDSNGQNIMYTDNLAAGKWSSPVSVSGAGAFGPGVSMAIDPSGKSYISYYESIASQLRFATNFNGTWASEAVTGTGLVAPFTSIAVSTVAGQAMIAYYDQSNKQLRSVEGTIGSWSAPLTIYSVTGAPFSALAKDSNNVMSVAFYDKMNATLEYSTLSNGAWKTSMVDSNIYSNGVLAVDLDSYDKVNIAYMSSSSHLMFVTSSGSKWALSSLEAIGNVGAQCQTASDGTYSYIVYLDQTDANNSKLMFLTDSPDGNWHSEQLIAQHAASPSMALGSGGKVYVSYVNTSGTHTMRYATNANGGWVETIVDSGNFGSVSSIAVSSSGAMFIAYRGDDVSSQNLVVAEYINGTRNIIGNRDVDHITTSNMKVVLDSANKAYVVYTTTQGIKVVSNRGGTWLPIGTVDTRLASGLSALMGPNDQIHMSYYIVGTNELVYRYGDANGWSADTVQSASAVAATSMVLDSKGAPRIAVSQSGTNSSLRVFEKIGGVWMASDVDPSSIGSFVSMVADKDDRYHVVYYSADKLDLLYAVSVTTPVSPTMLNGTRGDHSIVLTWAAPSSNGGAAVTKYFIYRGEAANNEKLVAQVGSDFHQYNDVNVTNANTMYYKVVAVNSEGASLASNEFSLGPFGTGTTTDNNSLMLLVIFGVIAVVVIAVVVILLMRKVKPRDKWKH